MLDRIAVGEIPKKHHVVLRGEDGSLRHELCTTRQGFDGAYTISYHLNRPHTHAVTPVDHGSKAPAAAPRLPLQKRHYKSQDLEARGGAPINAKVPLLFNDDLCISVLRPDEEDPVYVVNGDGDDLYFAYQGGGTVLTAFGELAFDEQDYVCIPKGVVHRLIPKGPSHWLHVECQGLSLLKQWRNATGQLRMDAPYCHRDFRRPTFLGPKDEGIRTLAVKRDHAVTGYTLEESPFDCVGWDGTVYPWAFPILNFQPRAGLVHLPPDWHGTFGVRGALICSFVPRVVDFHPEAIPCPYPHSSVDCDEMLFYVSGNFTSRRGVGPGSVSFHPAGIPHGPHPGAYEASVGTTRTNELAVMIDTFKPLVPTADAVAIEDLNYMASFR
ncbi:MAG: homogentisate 1,2-dioxygenase [Myxococcota bacterium]